MCLDSAKGPYIARKDIIVYKLFNRVDYKIPDPVTLTKYKSYYKFTWWPKKGLTSSLRVYKNHNDLYIEEGLHSFVNKKDAFNFKKGKGKSISLLHCVIPKGSIYYRGTFNHRNSIASDRLVIKKYYKKSKI